MELENRIVVLIDMDCFYCQVEEKLNPELRGKPIAVVQYNPWKGGGIIAVNYVARAQGVTRHMRGDEAREKCPDIELPSVPCQRGKADISKYREAGKDVARVLQKFTPLLERASIDEAYLDITAAVEDRLKTLNVNTVTQQMIPNTYALGYENIEQFIADIHHCASDSIEFDYDHAKRLLVGAVVVSEIRAAVYEETGYRCSAGIAHNKILAKLVCGMNKPNKQTVLPKHSINILYSTLSLKKVKHLGGKFGDTVCEVLKITKMGELQRFTEKELQARFDDKNGTWLYNIARGIDLEPVQARFNPKSIGCCKQLRGKSALHDIESLKKWLKDLGDEIEDRLEKDALENNRNPKQMVVSFSTQGNDGRDMSSSRSYNFVADDELCGDFFANKAFELVMESLEGVKPAGEEKNRKLKGPIKFLGISVGKFEDISESKKIKKIVDYFVAGASNGKKEDTKSKEHPSNKNSKKNEGKDFIMQKFLQCADKSSENLVKVKINADSKENVITESGNTKNLNDNVNKTEHNNKFTDNDKNIDNTKRNDNIKNIDQAVPVLQSPLDKQESFFAKFLNKETRTITEEKSRAITPQCNVVNCGENSNDTDYSGSTIDAEINKSIALFDEDAQDVERVSGMRDLLNQSSVTKEQSSEDDRIQQDITNILVENENNSASNQFKDNQSNSKPDVFKDQNAEPDSFKEQNELPENLETFQCTECGKTLPLHLFETHGDYHFALKLREEDRRLARDERQRTKPKDSTVKEVKRTKIEDQNKSNNMISSITSFLVKVDDSKPTEICPKCFKRVPLDKLPEHLDFHEAQKLSKELNIRSTLHSNVMNSSNSGVKRKRKSISPVKKPKQSCNSRSIDSFFR